MVKLAFCGDDCNYCPRYNATLNQNEHKLREIAVLWKKSVGVKTSILQKHYDVMDVILLMEHVNIM